GGCWAARRHPAAPPTSSTPMPARSSASCSRRCADLPQAVAVANPAGMPLAPTCTMELTVYFPGQKKVEVAVGPFVVHTDQSIAHGGEGTAPEPFTLFLASLGACAGVYVL